MGFFVNIKFNERDHKLDDKLWIKRYENFFLGFIDHNYSIDADTE